MRQYLKEVLYLLGEERRRLPWIVGLFLFSSLVDLIGLGLIVPYFYLVMGMPTAESKGIALLNHLGLQDAGREQQLLALGGMLIIVFLLKALLGIWANRSVFRFSLKQQTRLRSVLMTAYQGLPYTEYLRRNSVEYIHGIQVLTQHYANNIVVPSLRILGEGVVALVILGFLARSNSIALALMVVIFVPVVGGYHWLFRGKLKRYGQEANLASKRVVKAIHEGIEGLKEIRVLGKESYFHAMVSEGSNVYAQSFVKSQIITAAPRYLLELLLVVFVVSLVWATLGLGRDLQTLAPVLALFGMAALRLLPMVNTFSTGLLQLRFYRNSVAQLYTDLQNVSLFTATPGQFQVPQGTNDIGFESLRLNEIDFRYPGAAQSALAGIDMEIKLGESIGLIGASGSGKTTLIDVLLGLLEPQYGTIKYNGQPLHEQLSNWRRQVAYLPQQVFLVDDTLRHNVALGERDADIDNARLERAITNARLDELVKQLPLGVNTWLGERGVRLSGGQRQRIAIARAFYYGRNVLIMDEATSALDNETEREIVEEICSLKGQKTMIVIAHRLTTVMHCDRIYKLENGTILKKGSPAEILG